MVSPRARAGWGLRPPESLADAYDMLPTDVMLPSIRSGLRRSNDPQDSTSNPNLDLASSKPNPDLVEELVRAASDNGRIALLEYLRGRGLWHPETSSLALEAADEAGNLLQLLMAFQMPLALFPAQAHAHLQEAIDFFNNVDSGTFDSDATPELKKAESACSVGELAALSYAGAPLAGANLLANFLAVASPVAETVLDSIVEDMVVFQPRDDRVQSRNCSPGSFPTDMCKMYVSRFMGERKASTMEYDRQAQTLRIPSSRMPYVTSREFKITLTHLARKAALIPKRATKFTFIYHGEGLPNGGFLYCNHKGQPLVLNRISFSTDRRSLSTFSFGEHVALGAAVTEALRPRVQCVQAEVLRSGGATHYAWIGPGESLADGKFEAGVVGGFAYLFEDAGTNRFFPILGAGKASKTKTVVFHSQDEDLHSLPVDMDFPETLGAIYLQREMTVRGGKSSSMVYDSARRLLQLSPNGPKLQTSPEYPVTLTSTARRAALIPLRAAAFAYIHYGPGFPTGGFLYIGKDDKLKEDKKPMAVNSISFSHRRYALSFGTYELLRKETSRELEKRAQAISVDALLSQGAKQYCWVGPGERLPGDFISSRGGFAYLFEDPARNRFFPLEGAAEVVDRAEVFGSLNSVPLPAHARGLEITRSLTKPASILTPFLNFLARDPRNGLGNGVPVKIARLKVPEVLDPVVLHGLAYTPRAQALDTITAKAIAMAAFQRAKLTVFWDILLEAVSLAAITRITLSVREGSLNSEDFDDWTRYMMMLSFMFIYVVWMKNLIGEVSLFLGYYRRSWTKDYFTWHKSMVWSHVMMMFSLLAWVSAGIAYREFNDPDVARPLLAAVGCMKWIRLLYSFRGFEVFSLGPRILPILAALGEIKDFILIMLFFSGACVQASYALSRASSGIEFILFSAYRMGFLSDFDVNSDVLFLKDGEGDPVPWAAFQYSAFVVFSFVVAIALTNIFIGVMSNAFDYHLDRVGQLFVRTRAHMGLDFLLRGEGRQALFCCCFYDGHCCCSRRRKQDADSESWEDERLWLCYPRVEEGEEVVADGNTMRGSLSALGDRLSKHLGNVSERLGRLEAQLMPDSAAVGFSRQHTAADLVSDPGNSSMSPANLHPEIPHHTLSPRATHPYRTDETRRYRLHVTIVRAMGLRDADSFVGKSDAYCVCEVLGKPHTKFSTDQVNNCLDPVWNHCAEISDFEEEDVLKFMLWDRDVGKPDDFLGRVTFKGKDLVSTGFSGTVPLDSGEGAGAHACDLGKLELKVVVEGVGPTGVQHLELPRATAQDAEALRVDEVDAPVTVEVGIESDGSVEAATKEVEAMLEGEATSQPSVGKGGAAASEFSAVLPGVVSP